MDPVQKREGCASRWDNPFPVEKNSQNQSALERTTDQNKSKQSCNLKPSHLNLLASFGLSIEDLEELSHFPDDQLTPENMPVLLQGIQKRKLALKEPTLPSKVSEKEPVSNADGHGSTVKKKVIDYGHKSKYEYDKGPMEVNASSTAKDESVKGSQNEQPPSVPAAPSSLINKQKNPTKELIGQSRSQTNSPNIQAFPAVKSAPKVPLGELGVPAAVPPVMPPVVPPVPRLVMPPVVLPVVTQRPPPFAPALVEILSRHGRYEHTSKADPPHRSCQMTDGQKSCCKEAEEPFRSPFGVVKASWLPVFSQTDKQKVKKLPTPSEMKDYCAVPPTIFPHTCSLCNKICTDKTDWIQHQNSPLHSENCRLLLQQHPDWTPETPSSPQRHEGDRQERHESRQRSASPSPKRSRLSSSDCGRHRTRSRSRSSGCHRTSRSRSRSPRRLSSSRHRSRSPRQSSHSSGRSRSHQTRSRSRSCGHYRTSRSRSRSPRHLSSSRRRSRSPRQSLYSSGLSQSSSSKERGSGSSTRSIDKLKAKKLPTLSQMKDCYAVTPTIFPHTCALCNEVCKHNKDWIQHQSSPLHSENCRLLFQQHPDWTPETPSSPRRHEGDRQERHESRQRSASPSPKRSRLSSSDCGRHRTRSRSRSSGCHRTSRSRSRSPRRLSSSRHRSRSPRQSSHSSGRSRSHQTRSRSRSCGHYRTSRSRSRSPRHLPSSRRRSRSPRQSLYSSGRSRSHQTRSRSRSCGDNRTSRSRSQSPRRHPSPRRRSRSPRQSLHSSGWSRTRSRSRSCGHYKRSRSRSRSPRHLPSPRRRSGSPRQSLHSSGPSRSSSSKERGSRSSTRSIEGRRAHTPCSKKRYDEQKQTHSSADSRKKGCEDLRWRSEDVPCQKLSADETGSQTQKHDKLLPERQSQEESECSALASLTERSILQAMAQLQAQGAAGGTLSQGRDPALLAAGVTSTSTVSSDLVSMIQQVAKQVITAVLDSKEASATQASTSVQDPNPQQGNSVTRKAKTQSVVHPILQSTTSGSSEANAKSVVGPSSQQGTAKSTKPKPKGLGSACPKKGASLSSKAKNKQEEGQCPKKSSSLSGKTKNKPKASLCPKKSTSLCSKAKNERVESPCVQQGSAASAEEENQAVVDRCPEQGIALSDKAANDSMVGLSPHQGTAAGGKAENQGVAGAHPLQGTAKIRKSENEGVASCSLSEGGTAGNSEAASQHVANPVPHQGTAARGEMEDKCLGVHSSQQGIGPNSQAGSRDSELEPVPGSTSPCSGTPGQVPKPRVRIYGDSLVVSAQKRASSTRVGLQLGLEELIVLEWHGQEHMTWKELVPTIQNLAARGQTPDVIIIHLGGDDLVHVMELELLSLVKRVLFLLRGLLPQVKVIWSEIIPQGVWHGVDRVDERKKLNTAVGASVASYGGAVIRHPRISSEDPELYNEKAYLSDAGLDIFLEDIKNGILAQVLQSSKAASGGGIRLPPPASPGLGCVSREAATWEDEVVSSSEEVSGLQTNTGEASVSSQPVSKKAGSSVVASPRPQPGTSGTCKAKKQTARQKQVAGRVPSCSGSAGPLSKPRVWICGHSVVASAQQQAAATRLGSQLGLEKSIVLEWHGQEDLTWDQLLPFLQKLTTQSHPPDVLIVHLGEDDLAHALEYGLLTRVKKQLCLLTKSFPTVKVLWSEMLPWGTWHGGERGWKRSQGNRTLGQYIKLFGGDVIKHSRISSEDPELYSKKGNLSSAGLAMFLEDIKNGILAHLRQPSRAASGRLNKSKTLPPPSSPVASAVRAPVSKKVATREDEVVSSSKETSSLSANAGEAAVSPQPMKIKAETSGVASPSPQPGKSGTCKAKNREVEQKLELGSVPPCQGEAAVSFQPVSINAKAPVVASPSLPPGTSVRCKAKNQDVAQNLDRRSITPCVGEAAVSPQPMKIKAETSGVASPSPQPGKSGACKAKNRKVEQKLELGSVPPCQGEAAVSSQPVSIKAEAPGGASPGPKIATSGPSKVENEDVTRKGVLGSVAPCPGEAAVSSQPVSIKAEAPGGASPSLQLATCGPSKAENEDVVQERFLGSVPPCPGEAAVSSQPVSIKAEAPGVASPSSQLATCGPSKAENEDVVQERLLGSVVPCPVTCEQAAKPRVWICGDALVVCAQKWDTQKRQFGQLDWLQQNIILEWHGQEDLTWSQLVPTLQKRAVQGQAPDVLVVHLGEKDFLSTPWPELRRIIKKQVVLLKEVFPQVRLMWSEMLPQNISPAEGNALEDEKALQEANLVLGEFISSCGGVVIKHVRTSNTFPMLTVGGSSLSHIGLDIFLEDIKNGIRSHVLQSSGAASGGLKEGRNFPPFAPLAASAGLVSVRQELAVQLSFSEEERQIQKNSGGVTVSSQPASCVSHQKKVQVVEQKPDCGTFRFRLGKDRESSGSPRHSSKPRVWICGESVVVSAQKRASSTAAGSQLGLEQSIVLEWCGQENLKWIQLLPFLQNLVTWSQAPDVLIIHLGGKDLARAVEHVLVERVKGEWFFLKTLFPQVRVIWSAIIPQGTECGKKECFRQKKLNGEMGWSIKNLGGDVIEHPRISSKDPKLYVDEANLSPAGLDIFLEDIRNWILAHVALQSSGAADDGLNQGVSLTPPVSAPAGLASMSQEAATREDEVVSSSEEASGLQTSTAGAAGSSQPVSSKAENVGVASPSPQPGTSGTFKTKNQEAGQKLVVGSFPLCSRFPRHLSMPRVWICGHSVVAAAQKQAAVRIGCHLGLEESIVLEWHGHDGMLWRHLIPYLQDLVAYRCPPDVLIIHLGESDFTLTQSPQFLIKTIKAELFLVKELFPSVKVLWSHMITSLSWLGVPCAEIKELWVREVNLDVGQYVKAQGGAVIEHPRISSQNPKLYMGGGNLSKLGLDIFWEDIRIGILEHAFHSCRVADDGLRKGVRLPPPASLARPHGLGSLSQEAATRTDEAVSSSDEPSSQQTSTAEAAVSSQPVSSKAENLGVASPGPQPGTSGNFTTENQDVDAKLVFGTIPSCPATSAGLVSVRQEVAVQGDQAVSSSKEASQMQRNTERAAVNSQPGSYVSHRGKVQMVEQKPIWGTFRFRLGRYPQPGIPPTLPWFPFGASPLTWKTGSLAFPYTISPYLATLGPCKTEKEAVAHDRVLSSVPPSPGKAVVSPQPLKIKAETSGVASPSPQPGKSGARKAKNRKVEQKLELGSSPACQGEAAVSPQPLKIKAATSGVASPRPQPGKSGARKAKNRKVEQKLELGSSPACQGEAAVSSQPVSIKAEDPVVASPSPQPGKSGTCKAKNQEVEQKLELGSSPPCQGEAGVSSQPVSIKAEDPDVASPGPQVASSGPSKAENEDVTQEGVLDSIPPCPGEAAVSSQPVSIKAEDPVVASPSPQPGKSGARKAKIRKVEQKLELGSSPACQGEAGVSSQPVSIKAEDPDVASPGPQVATSGSSKAENEDVTQEGVLGIIPPCPGEAAVSSQPVSIKAEAPGVASPSPQLATCGPSKTENEDVVQERFLGSIAPCPGEAAVSPQPLKIKAETSGVASPSPQPGKSGACKAKNRKVEQKLELGSVPPCQGEAAVSSQPVSIKAEDPGVTSPSPQPGTSVSCKAKSQDVAQNLEHGSITPFVGKAAVSPQPMKIKAETSGVASPSPQVATSDPSKGENEDVTQEGVLGSVAPCPGEAAVSSQPVSIKAEDPGVASPGPQVASSGPSKAENEDVTQEGVLGIIPPCPGNAEPASKRRVWVCGQSVVLSAEKQASSTKAGSQLGLEERIDLEWHGQEGLTWTQLVPTLQRLAAQGQAPDGLVVHLGEKDLECSRGAQLSCTIKKELVLVKELFPHVRILWSNLLRRRGFGKAGSRTVNRARTMVNLEVGLFIVTLGGAVIEHPAILHTDPDFYVDGDNLSCRGLDVFLEDIKNGILSYLHS